MNHDMIWGFGLHGFTLSPGHLEFELFALAQHSQLACDGALLLGAQQPNSQFKNIQNNNFHKTQLPVVSCFHFHIKHHQTMKFLQPVPPNLPRSPGLTDGPLGVVGHGQGRGQGGDLTALAAHGIPKPRPAPWDGRNHAGGIMGGNYRRYELLPIVKSFFG